MRHRVLALAATIGLAACSSSGPKTVSPGIARFVGTWEAASTGPSAVLVVQADQRARLLLTAPGERPSEIRGVCTPGADTMTFAEVARAGATPRVYLFATRPDGSLAVTIENVPLRLRRR